MKKFLLIVLSLMLAVAFVACSAPADNKAADGGAASGGDKNVVIAVVPQQLGNVVFLPAKAGAEAKGQELGITVEWVAPVKAEASEQVAVIEGLIERKIDGIAISCNTPDALKDVLARAIKEGIQVSTFDADSPESGRAFYAGTENYQAGFICGEQMVALFKDSGLDKVRVAQLEGIPGAFDIEARKQGFADAIKGTNIEVIYSGACDDDVDKSIEIVEAYTRANAADIDAWFMAGGWPYVVNPDAMPEVNSWKNADPMHKVVTMDVFPSSMAFFDQKLIDVAVGQDFYSMGQLSVENLNKLIKGEAIQADEVEGLGKFIDTGVQIINADNYKTEIPAE